MKTIISAVTWDFSAVTGEFAGLGVAMVTAIAGVIVSCLGFWGVMRAFRTLMRTAETFVHPSEQEKFDFNAAGQGPGWNEYRHYGGSEPSGFGRGSGLRR